MPNNVIVCLSSTPFLRGIRLLYVRTVDCQTMLVFVWLRCGVGGNFLDTFLSRVDNWWQFCCKQARRVLFSSLPCLPSSSLSRYSRTPHSFPRNRNNRHEQIKPRNDKLQLQASHGFWEYTVLTIPKSIKLRVQISFRALFWVIEPYSYLASIFLSCFQPISNRVHFFGQWS